VQHERLQQKKKNGKKAVQQKQADVFPQVFCRSDMVRLKKGQPYQLQLQFIPLIMEHYRVLVVFSDAEVGEFQHEILTTVDLPEQTLEFKSPNVFVEQLQVHEQQIPFKNEAMLRGRRVID
jgi:hypothetical protein